MCQMKGLFYAIKSGFDRLIVFKGIWLKLNNM